MATKLDDTWPYANECVYQCAICLRAYLRMGLLKQHFRTMHPTSGTSGRRRSDSCQNRVYKINRPVRMAHGDDVAPAFDLPQGTSVQTVIQLPDRYPYPSPPIMQEPSVRMVQKTMFIPTESRVQVNEPVSVGPQCDSHPKKDPAPTFSLAGAVHSPPDLCFVAQSLNVTTPNASFVPAPNEQMPHVDNALANDRRSTVQTFGEMAPGQTTVAVPVTSSESKCKQNPARTGDLTDQCTNAGKAALEKDSSDPMLASWSIQKDMEAIDAVEELLRFEQILQATQTSKENDTLEDQWPILSDLLTNGSLCEQEIWPDEPVGLFKSI